VDGLQAIVGTMLEDNKAGKWSKGSKEALEWRKALIKIF